jgi:hypothetical protein
MERIEPARRRTRSAVLPQGGRHAAHSAAKSMAESINVTAEDSLRRLQTDYIHRIADLLWT